MTQSFLVYILPAKYVYVSRYSLRIERVLRNIQNIHNARKHLITFDLFYCTVLVLLNRNLNIRFLQFRFTEISTTTRQQCHFPLFCSCIRYIQQLLFTFCMTKICNYGWLVYEENLSKIFETFYF